VLPNRDYSFLGSLAHNLDKAIGQIEINQGDADSFGSPQTGIKQGYEESMVSCPGRGLFVYAGDNLLDFSGGERFHDG